MWETAALRLGIAAVVLSLLAIAFGYQSGAGLSDVLQRLRKRVHTMISTNDPHVPVKSSRHYGNGELAELLRAINGLEERFASELVLYKDALEEVRAFGAQRTSYLKAIARELRTPLNSIIIESQKLAEDPTSKLSQTQLEDLRIIQKAGRRLLTGVDEILDLSALMSGNLQFDKDRIDIPELAAEVVETAKGELGQRDIKIKFEKQMAGEIAVHGNRQRLWQVITNLVGNAIKFTEHGEIKVIVGKTGDGKVTIEVIDTGVGIPPGDQQAIFDPFSQSGKRSKRRRGTGLGLAIVQRLVKLHGGSIYVSSREGQGSHFTVTLP
jgi:signal transduction histidine kinase